MVCHPFGMMICLCHIDMNKWTFLFGNSNTTISTTSFDSEGALIDPGSIIHGTAFPHGNSIVYVGGQVAGGLFTNASFSYTVHTRMQM